MRRVKPLFKSKRGEGEFYKAYDRTLTLWPVPLEEQDVSTSFGSTHVIVSGSPGSPPLMLFHSAQASSTMWFPNIEALSRDHRVYAVDFILEAGKSVPRKPLACRADLTQWLVEILDHYGLEKPGLIGISRGAWNAVALALSRPERVGALILLSPAQALTSITNLSFVLTSLLSSINPTARRLAKMTRLAFFNPAGIAPLFLEQYKCGLRHFNLRYGFSLPPTLFTDDELRSVRAPTLLLIGDHDVVNTPAAVERARNMMSQVDAGIVENAGHILTMDQAGSVNERIVRFLAESVRAKY